MQVYSGIIRMSSEEKFSYVIIQKRPKTSAPGTLDQLKRKLSAVDATNRHSHSATAKPGKMVSGVDLWIVITLWCMRLEITWLHRTLL